MRYIFAAALFAQIVIIIVAPQDVEVKYGEAAWAPADVVSVEYSSEPLRQEKKIGKAGLQIWECMMCDSTAESPRKAIIKLNCPAPPSPQDRIFYVRARNRFSDDSDIGPWGESGKLKITGRPRNVE